MSAADRPRVGVIGVGVMGGAMAGHLAAAGFEVCGYDVDAAKVEASAANPVESVAEVAARSDVVLMSLPSVSALDTVAAELAAAEPAGRVAVEMGTLPLEPSRRKVIRSGMRRRSSTTSRASNARRCTPT